MVNYLSVAKDYFISSKDYLTSFMQPTEQNEKTELVSGSVFANIPAAPPSPKNLAQANLESYRASVKVHSASTPTLKELLQFIKIVSGSVFNKSLAQANLESCVTLAEVQIARRTLISKESLKFPILAVAHHTAELRQCIDDLLEIPSKHGLINYLKYDDTLSKLPLDKAFDRFRDLYVNASGYSGSSYLIPSETHYFTEKLLDFYKILNRVKDKSTSIDWEELDFDQLFVLLNTSEAKELKPDIAEGAKLKLLSLPSGTEKSCEDPYIGQVLTIMQHVSEISYDELIQVLDKLSPQALAQAVILEKALEKNITPQDCLKAIKETLGNKSPAYQLAVIKSLEFYTSKSYLEDNESLSQFPTVENDLNDLKNYLKSF